MVGSFNPTIFQPHWLGAQGLIRTKEAENATIAIIQEQVADFKTEWFRMQVLQKRFMLHALDASHYSPVRDLAAGIFRLLSHTPVRSLTMGRWFHYKMESTDAWHKVGNTLTPKEFWSPLVDGAGMRSLTMLAKRKGIENGNLSIKTEPSVLVPNGVYIEVNEEYKTPDPENANAEWVPPLLTMQWDPIMKYGEDLARDLLERVDKNA